MWIFEACIQKRTHGLSADVFVVHVWTFTSLYNIDSVSFPPNSRKVSRQSSNEQHLILHFFSGCSS